MKKILSLILAFSFFASEASFMDKVKALPGKAKEFALATKDAAKANKPKAIFTTLQIAVAAHRLHALGMPESKRTLLTEDTNNFFSFGEYSPLGCKALEFTKTINIYFGFDKEDLLESFEGKLSSLGDKVDNEVSLAKGKGSSNLEVPSYQYSTAGNTGTMVNKNSENTGGPSKYSTEGEERLSQATGETGNSGAMKNQVSFARNKNIQDKPLMPEVEPLSNKNLRPIKYVQDFFNDGIGGTLFILEILKRVTTKAK